MSNEIVLRKIQALGIPDPLSRLGGDDQNRSSRRISPKRILDEPTFRGYMGDAQPVPDDPDGGIEGIFRWINPGCRTRCQNTIETAMTVLKTRLDRPDITPLEARENPHRHPRPRARGAGGIQRAAHPDRRAGGVRHDGAGGRGPEGIMGGRWLSGIKGPSLPAPLSRRLLK